MSSRFGFQPRYFLAWLLWFEVARAVFVVYQWDKASALPAATLLGTFGYGLWLDASAAAYCCVLPFTGFVVSALAGERFSLGRLVAGYTAVVGLVLALLLALDLGLYRAWGFRLDGTLLQYLSTPREMAASAGSAPRAGLLLALAGLLLAGGGLYGGLTRRLPALPAGFGRAGGGLARH
ncbi:MAG: hypothetical protein EOO59_20735, partial [Hymenobacter sp.]